MTLRSLPTLALAATLLSASGCDDDQTTSVNDTADTSADTTADTSSADAAPGPDTSPEPDTNTGCEKVPFVPVAQDAGPFLGAFMYVAQSTLDTPVDTLAFELIGDNGGATAAGAYELTDAPYESCGNCVVLRLACDGELSNCNKALLATSGTLEITEFGESGGKFSGTLTDAILREVSIAPDNKSVLVDKGEVRCLDTYTFEATVQ